MIILSFVFVLFPIFPVHNNTMVAIQFVQPLGALRVEPQELVIMPSVALQKTKHGSSAAHYSLPLYVSFLVTMGYFDELSSTAEATFVPLCAMGDTKYHIFLYSFLISYAYAARYICSSSHR